METIFTPAEHLRAGNEVYQNLMSRHYWEEKCWIKDGWTPQPKAKTLLLILLCYLKTKRF